MSTQTTSRLGTGSTDVTMRWRELLNVTGSVNSTVEDMAIRLGGSATPAEARQMAAQLADLFRQMAAECDDLAQA